ncbi:MAG: hypothetical protein M1835_002455 [Candelina submexicana]|nr:MAG: hypothetical protein M1835_002455 [Candelina submexicana]
MLTGASSQFAHSSQNAALILLSLFFLPLDTAILLFSYALRLLPTGLINQQSAARPRRRRLRQPKTILVTGVGMTKGLALARIFYEAGHNVIGADFEPSGVPVCGRFSASLKKFYKLTKPNPRTGAAPYVQELLTLIDHEHVDLWVSCSGVASAVEDGLAKDIVEKKTDCKVIQFDVSTTSTLHEKSSFIEKTVSLGLPAPETHTVTSRHAVHQVLHNAEVKQYIMKTVGMDDAARGDMTLLPRPTVSETYQHMSSIKINQDSPWVVQQYIKGEEYCTHALIVRGNVKVFVACPSSELLMHYQALPPQSGLSRAMLEFTIEFARRYGGDMTGHLSFDFLVEERESKKGVEMTLYPIECNPRAHTAVALFNGLSNELADAYLTALEPEMDGAVHANGHVQRQIVVPFQPAAYYWVGHDLVALIIYPLIQFLLGLFYGNASSQPDSTNILTGVGKFLQHFLFWKDGTYEVWDPLPWWWLYHVYWPGQFLACIIQGRKWSRINVSTTKIFGC